MEFMQFIFSSFWIWLGFFILLALIISFIFRVIARLIRRSMIRHQGWPPAHLDADGDFKENSEENKKKSKD